MTQLGIRPKVPFPHTYRGFHLVRSHGLVYGIPGFLEPEDIFRRGMLTSHPAILSAPSRQELEALIDGFDVAAQRPEFLGSFAGYNLVRHRGAVYGVPQAAGPVDLDLEEE